ncbi:hypothetical protein HID58_070792, partial [Brassica napus]
GGYRPTNHPYKLSFMKFTSIEPYEYNNIDMFLDLVEFRTILSGQLDNNFLIDVVGQAIDIGEKLSLQCSNGKEKKKIEFTLRDIKFKVHLLLKDDTGTTKFMLLDSIANGIIAESAEKILKGSLIEISLLTDGEESSVTLKTPTSKRSQAMKDDVPELTSTSKRQCAKNIKIEK